MRGIKTSGLAAAVLGIMAASNASAAIIITEVDPSGSGNSSAGVDWFELTNTGTSSVSTSGWKMDDSSSSFNSAVAMSTLSIGAGESVVFLEGSSSDVAAFQSEWNLASSVQVGYYSGSGVGLSTSGDGVTVFNSSGVQQAKVTFGASTDKKGYATFDNTAELDNVTLGTFSVVGVNGAYLSSDGDIQG